jgi:hypothetical protein
MSEQMFAFHRSGIPCGLGRRLPDGEAPLCDGGAAGQLPQFDVGAYRPDEPHRVGQLLAPRDLRRPRHGGRAILRGAPEVTPAWRRQWEADERRRAAPAAGVEGRA